MEGQVRVEGFREVIGCRQQIFRLSYHDHLWLARIFNPLIWIASHTDSVLTDFDSVLL